MVNHSRTKPRYEHARRAQDERLTDDAIGAFPDPADLFIVTDGISDRQCCHAILLNRQFSCLPHWSKLRMGRHSRKAVRVLTASAMHTQVYRIFVSIEHGVSE